MKQLLYYFASLFFSLSLFAQNKSYKHFRDYSVSSNIDSLQKVVDSQRNQLTKTYMHSLIELEISRNYFSNDFGKDLESIKKAALLNKNQQALAMYNFLKAMRYQYTDRDDAFNCALEAMKYFKQQKDTSGLININKMILRFPDEQFPDDREKFIKPIFFSTLSYYNQINNIQDKLHIIILRLAYGHHFGLNIKEQFTFYKIGLRLLDEYPQYNYLRYLIYHGGANVYYRMPDKKGNHLRQVQRCYLLAYQSFSSKNIRSAVMILRNLGASYSFTNELKQEAFYYKKAINLYIKSKIDDLVLLQALYFGLSDTEYSLKKYKEAYENKAKSVDIQYIIDKELKARELRDLLAKYETEKKDVVIKNLQLQKQAVEFRTRLITSILLLTFVIIVGVSFLTFRLYDTNKSLKQLTRIRDKLFTIISHDLRSPLSSYQRYSEVVAYLVKTQQFDKLKEVLKKIDEIGLNLATLLNNLLEWSITQSREIKLSSTTINIKKFFSNILPIYRDIAILKEITIVENGCDIEVSLNVNVLALIVRNLLDNAIKYSPFGSTISIIDYIKGDSFIIQIKNSGKSMTSTQQIKIDKLFNENYNYEFGEDGLGIGLILIKEFTKASNIKVKFIKDAEDLMIFEIEILNAFS